MQGGQKPKKQLLTQVQRDQQNARRRKLYAEKRERNKQGDNPETDQVSLERHTRAHQPELLGYPLTKNHGGDGGSHVYEKGSSSTQIGALDKGIGSHEQRRRSRKQEHTIAGQPSRLPNVGSCLHCHAKRFPYEPNGFCCCQGEVKVYDVSVPEELIQLYCSDSVSSRDFRKHIRPYNNAFSFTSFGVILDTKCTSEHTGIYTFRAQGQVYHFMNSLYPSDQPPAYLQLYFYDTDREVSNRLDYASNLQRPIIEKLIDILQPNPYSVFFRSLREIPNLETHEIRLRADPRIDTGTLSAPTASQVAAIWCENEESPIQRERDIVVHMHSGHSQRIRYYFGCYDPLQYPLLFPLGEPGWHQGIEKVRKGKNLILENREVTAIPNLFPTAAEFLTNESQGRLLQQFAVDMYVKIESSRLDYYRNNQTTIRADLYQGIVDSIAQGESHGSKVGRRIVLPGSFIGGPRDMRKRYLDAMTLVERYGKPDIFLTMTCNPNWPEIQQELRFHDQAQNRPDLVIRIFRSKFEQLKKEVITRELFGPVAAYTYVVEFQKRGLPHVHMLVILKRGYKLNTVEKFDTFISAELPNPSIHPNLYSMVVRHMMHGPCGDLNPSNVCMKHNVCLGSDKCKDHYPRPYTNETKISADGYPIYRRTNDGQQAKVRGHMLGNQWIVPYNPYLLSLFDCHINVEVCSTIKAVKYLYKYMYKGHDKVVFQIVSQENRDEVDEITQFQSARWVSPPEAMWRIFRFSLHHTHPSVSSLQLHLEDCQIISFRQNSTIEHIANSDFYSRTMLTQFFYMNGHNDLAKVNKYLYKEFPSHFVWIKKTRQWTVRKRKNVIGRIITANPTEGERYYLRLLLNHVHGPTSYLSLKQVNGNTYSTFRESALAYGLLKDDRSNETCLDEACIYQMPISLRNLFCTILAFCNPVNPRQLFLTFEDAMTDDYTSLQRMSPNQARHTLLTTLRAGLESLGKNINDYNMSDLCLFNNDQESICKEILDEQNFIISESDLKAVSMLNEEQKIAFTEVIDAVLHKASRCFFIDGPGGTGKTFLYRALLATVRSNKQIALATATSGVAASILPNGRTAHSRFKIPINGSGKLSCNISKQTDLAKLLRAASLIIWDEASMAKKENIEALDEMLRDLTDVDYMFGGKVVVLGGDFRQVLPVIPKGNKEDCINASLVRSYIWQKLKKFKLKENMRARTDPLFSSYLLRVGNGTEVSDQLQQIEIPIDMLLKSTNGPPSIQDLIDFVFPDLNEYAYNAITMTSSAILTPKNNHVDEINNTLMSRFPGNEEIYFSVDETLNQADQGLYVDFLHTLTPNGMPPHELILKKNCPIMLLRNINPSKGLCNGTRLICRAFEKHTIIAEIAVGEHKGEIVFIPRIPLQPSDPKLYPVEFTRRQFPVRPCFAMTINKAQGQTLNIVGIYLPQPVFSHGQLYVALSRATSSVKIKMLLQATALPEQAMATQTLMISDVTPGMRNWSVPVMVTEKTLPKLGSNDKPYQKLMLQDVKGTIVQATIFGSDIDILADTLQIFHVYTISNATVQPIPSQHKIIENPYQWILYARTPIEEIQVDGLNVQSLTYNFTRLGELADHSHPGETVDALFAILHVGQFRKVTESYATDVTIIDQSMVPTTLTLWDQFGSKEGGAMSRLPGLYPVVIGMRLKISHFNGIALATKGTTSFIFNPPLPEANTLHNWCVSNSVSIKHATSNKAKKIGGSRLSPPAEEDIIKIKNLPITANNMEIYALHVTCCVVDLEQRFWYLCCSDCGRVTDAVAGYDFWCNYCKKKLPPKPRCKFDVELGDSTGLIVATAFGEIAESLFGITAEELYDKTNGGEINTECIEKLTTPRDYGIHVQAAKYDSFGNSYCKYTIKAVHDEAAIKPTTVCCDQQPLKRLKRGLNSNDTSILTTTESDVIHLEDAGPKLDRAMKKKSE